MKKTYTKPEVTEIAVQPNQAVAACGLSVSGYDNSWQRGNGGQYGWADTESAWNAYSQHANYTYSENPDSGLFVFPIVYGETIDANGTVSYGTFYDHNWNGIMDGNEYIAWQQGDYTTISSAFQNGSAPVNS